MLLRRRKRVMVLGLDCAEPELVFNRWGDELPNLKRLMEQGGYGEIQSSIPPITVPAWACFCTSKNPGQLGFFGFRNRKGHSYHDIWIATGDAVKEPRVWDIASREGKDCIILGVPQTYPPTPLKGLMVTSFLTPGIDSQYTYPPALKQEIADVVGEYMIDVEGFRTEDKDGLLKQIYDMTAKRFALARHFVRTKPWDLFFLVEMGPDRIHHGFWKFCDPEHMKYEPGNKYETAILDYYKYLDKEIGDLLGLLPRGTAIIVVSDHGAKRMDGSLNINDWMIQEGFMRLSEPLTEPCDIREAPIDWLSTKAWGSGGYYARVFMNVRGREEQGCIDPAEYEQERDRLAQAIKGIQDQTGRVMNTKVHKPQDVYTGPHVSEAPDLLVYFDDLYWRSSQTVGTGSIHSFETEIGPDDAMHAEKGIFIMTGGGIRGGKRLHDVDILDGAPTMLRLLGLPIPGDMEGKAIG